MPGLFGDIDINEIPEDPYHVDPGTYLAVLSKGGVKRSKDGTPAFATQFKIDDQDAGSNNGQSIGTWNTLFPDATEEDLDANDGAMRKQLSYFRKFLTDLGIPAEEHGRFDGNVDEYLGQVYVITVTESPDKSNPDIKYSNIQTVKQYDGA